MVTESDRDDFREAIPVQIRHHGHLRDSAVDGNAQTVRTTVPEPLLRCIDATAEGSRNSGLVAEAAIRIEGDLAIFCRADQAGLQIVLIGIAVIGQYAIGRHIQHSTHIELVLVIYCLRRAVDIQNGNDKATRIHGTTRIAHDHAHIMGANLAFQRRPAHRTAAAVDTQASRCSHKAEAQGGVFRVHSGRADIHCLPPHQGLGSGKRQRGWLIDRARHGLCHLYGKVLL